MTIYELIARMKSDYDTEDFTYILNDSYRNMLPEDSASSSDRKIYSLFQKCYSVRIITRENQRTINDSKKDYETRDGKELTPFNEDETSLLTSLDFEKLPKSMKARIYDVLWLSNKNYQYALIASDTYFELYQETFSPDEWVKCTDYVTRALMLVWHLHNDDHRDKFLQKIYSDIISVDGKDMLFLSTTLIELLLKYDFPLDQNTLENLLDITDKLIARRLPGNLGLRDSYETKAAILHNAGDNQSEEQTYIDYAEELMRQSDPITIENRGNNGEKIIERDWFIAEHNIEEAIAVFQNHGRPDRAKDAQKLLTKVQKHIIENLGVHKSSLDVTELCNQIDEATEGHDTKNLIVDLTLSVRFMRIDELRAQVLNHSPVFLNLVNVEQLDSSGHEVYRPSELDPDNEESIKEHMYFAAQEMECFNGFLANRVVQKLRSQAVFSEHSLDFIFEGNAIIPEGRANILRHGIYLGLSGDPYTSLHVLAPQMEHFIGHIAELCGERTVYYKVSTGIQQANVLGTIFESPALKEAFDENILFTFNGLLQQKAGSNIRNRIAHGLMEEKESQNADNLYFICAVLKLIAMYSPEWERVIEERMEEKQR